MNRREKAASKLIYLIHKSANSRKAIDNALSLQTHLPVANRREGLTPDELKKVEKGERRWLPRIFESYGTPVHEMLSSPLKGAIVGGLGLGAIGALGGGAMGFNLGRSMKEPFAGSLAGALAGGTALGGLGALTTYFQRKSTNEGLKDMMARLGPGEITKRDLLSDPVYNQDNAMREYARHSGMNNPYMRPTLAPTLSYDF